MSELSAAAFGDVVSSLTSSAEYNLNKDEIIKAMREGLDSLGMVAMPEDITLDFPDVFTQLWLLLLEALAKHRDFSKFAVGLPRGHGKTIVLKLLILYIILFTDRRFILVVGATGVLAENIIADVQDMLDSENIRVLFGNWRNNMEIDRLDFKKFKFLERDIILKGVGAGTALRGINVKNKRPDVIILDDAQTKECATSIVEAIKFLGWFLGTLMKAKSPYGCTYIYVGNMYTDLEIKKASMGGSAVYGCMLRNLALNKGWRSFIVGAILADGKALWEELFPLSQLYEELEQDMSMGSQDVFFAEVLNDPQASSGQHLDITKLSPFEVEEASCVGKFIVIDPMSGKKDPKLDGLAIGLWEVHDGRPVLVKLSHEQLTPAECIHLCLKWCEESGCKAIAAESVAYQSTLLFWFAFICNQLQIEGIELVEVMPGGRSKSSRILGFFKAWMLGEVLVSEEPYSRVLTQAIHYNPMKTNNKDDIIDMCAYAQDMLLKHPSSIALSTEYDVMGELLNSGQLIEGNIYS